MKLDAIITEGLQKRQTAPTEKYTCKHCGESFDVAWKLANHSRLTHKHPAFKPTKTEPGKPMSGTELAHAYPGIIKRLADIGTGEAFKKHPEWKEKLTARGEPMQNVYLAVTYMRGKGESKIAKAVRNGNSQPAPEKVIGRGFGWSQAAKDLAVKIMSDPQFKGPKGEIRWQYVFEQHPDWAITLKFNEYKKFNSFVNRTRKQMKAGTVTSAVSRVQQGATGERYSKEAEDLMIRILSDPQFKGPGGNIRWLWIFEQHPDWATTLRFNNNGWGFKSFLARVRHKLATAQAQAPVQAVADPGVAIVVAGKGYSLGELEAIIEAQSKALNPVKWCPECGYNLLMHSKAYSIASRHHRAED